MDADARKSILSRIIVRFYVEGYAKILIPLKIPDQMSNCSLFFTLLLDVHLIAVFQLVRIRIVSFGASPRFFGDCRRL